MLQIPNYPQITAMKINKRPPASFSGPSCTARSSRKTLQGSTPSVVPLQSEAQINYGVNETVKIDVREFELKSPKSILRFSPFSFELTRELPFACVVGPSGSGKTTFFKSLIPRFLQDWCDESQVRREISITVNNISINETQYRIGYAAQKPFFVSHRTTMDNLTAPFKWKGCQSPPETTIQETIQDFHLTAILNRYAYQLSAGERQRVNLARMFLSQPQLVLMDECLSPMDEDLTSSIANTIASKYCKKCRILIIGHRSSDLAPFSAKKLIFSYNDKTENDNIQVRNVTVTI